MLISDKTNLHYYSTTHEIPNMRIIDSFGVYTACVHYSLMPILEETEEETDRNYSTAYKQCINIIAKKVKHTKANALIGMQISPLNYSRTMLLTISAMAVQVEEDEVAINEYRRRQEEQNEKLAVEREQERQAKSIEEDIQEFKKTHNTKESTLYALQQLGKPCTVDDIIAALKINVSPVDMLQVLKGLCDEGLVSQENSTFKFNI